MKKPHYPLLIKLCILIISGIYIAATIGSFDRYPPHTSYELFLAGSLSGVYVALVIGLLSSLYILREKESLYITVLISFMIVFFETLVGYTTGILDGSTLGMYIFLIILHLIILSKLSYMCFDALAGGGNYNKKKGKKKKK